MCLGIPGRITDIVDAENLIATVDILGVRRQINITCVVGDDHPPQACIGDWVLVHVGFAMSRIDEAEAQETLRLLNELAELQGEMEALAASGAAA